ALLGCPDEGVWAYVGCGNARRRARDCRASLGCPDEGVWAYVSLATHCGVLKIAELCSAAQTRASGPTSVWQRTAACSRLPSFARLPRRGLGLRGVWQRTAAGSRLLSFARLPRLGRLGLRECET